MFFIHLPGFSSFEGIASFLMVELVITPTVVSATTFAVDFILILSVASFRSRILFPLLFLSSVTEKCSMTSLYKKILKGIAYTID